MYKTITIFATLGLLASVGESSVTGLGLLAPLIPVAQITGHAGLWAHGLTSAALLKLKAAGALAGLFLLSGRGIELNLGNEGGGWGWGSEGPGWDKRKKRDVSRDDNLNTYDLSFDEVLAYDQLGCGLRFVCELSAESPGKLPEDERLVLELFSRNTKSLHPLKSSKGKLSYTYAALIGMKDGSSTCGRVYAQCPYSRNQIMQHLRTLL